MALLPNYYRWIASHFRDHVRGTVLELGCGAGMVVQHYLERVERVVGVDVNDELLRRLEANHPGGRVRGVRVDLRGDWHELDGLVADVVIALDVLEHFEDDAAFVARAKAHLAPGGVLVLKVPAQSRLYGPMDEASGHFRRYDAEPFAALLERAGFETLAAADEPDRRVGVSLQAREEDELLEEHLAREAARRERADAALRDARPRAWARRVELDRRVPSAAGVTPPLPTSACARASASVADACASSAPAEECGASARNPATIRMRSTSDLPAPPRADRMAASCVLRFEPSPASSCSPPDSPAAVVRTATKPRARTATSARKVPRSRRAPRPPTRPRSRRSRSRRSFTRTRPHARRPTPPNTRTTTATRKASATSRSTSRCSRARSEKELRVDVVISKLQLPRTAVVGDLGCGPGIFTMAFAAACPEGVVYASDIEPAQIDRVREKVEQRGLRNVVPVLAGLQDPHFPLASLDVVFVADTYHHLEDRIAYFKRIKDVLKPDGRLVVLDYKPGKLPVGPAPKHKLPEGLMDKELERAGYVLIDRFNTHAFHDFEVWRPRRTWEGGD